MTPSRTTQLPPLRVLLRITVVGPPAGVEFRLQQGRSELVAPTRGTASEIRFDFGLRLGPRRPGQQPTVTGKAAQGPPAGRFVYVNSGRRAGQQSSCWDRRAKVPLQGITKALLEGALGRDDVVLEARIAGIAGDGGPACASVPLLGDGWRLVAKAAA